MAGKQPTLVLAVMLAFALALGAACGGGSKKSSSDAGAQASDAGSDAAGDAVTTFGDAPAQQLSIQPENQTLTANGPGATVQFSAYLGGTTTPVQAQWSVTSGLQAGSISATGLYTTSGQVGGTVNVQAQSGALTAQTQLHVVLDVVDNAGSVPTSVQQQLEAGEGDAGMAPADAGDGGTGPDPGFVWLYPYNATVFPRGLLPPTLQFGGVAPDAVYVHVSFGSLDYKGFFGPSNPGQVTLSAAAWTTITQSASSSDSVQVQLTKISGGVVAGPITENWTIAQGSLKGTVYYESRYSSPTDNGATMRIKPGATQPDVLLGQCTVCHYVSADGSTLVAESDPSGTRTSAAYNLTSDAGVISQKPDETYALAALYKDGSLAMSGGLGGVSLVSGMTIDGVSPSRLFNVQTGAQVAAAGWDTAITAAVLPSFAPDGTQIVFNHYDTGMGHTLAVMKFDVTQLAFSNLVDIATDSNHYLAWPGFTPDGEWVVYEANSAPFISCSPACGGTPASYGNPKANLQIAHVPSKTTASLDELNGIAGGQYYLPFGEAAEGDMNYQATILPVAVGGYFWVVFTSRREYGNTINTADPYYCTPNVAGVTEPWRKKLWVAALDIDDPEHPSTSAHDISHPAFYLDGQDLQTGNYRGFWGLSPCQQMGVGCESGDECCSGFCRQVTGDGGVSADSGTDGGAEYVCVAPQACANEFEKCTTSADCCASGQGFSCIAGFCSMPPQ